MKIRTEEFIIPTAEIKGCNPLPAFRERLHIELLHSDSFPEELMREGGYMQKVLPYLTQDRYTHQRVPKALKSFVLENDYLEARFLPEYGGRLHSLYDKVEKRQLLFTNPVIQPGNLAIRNAWLSGGIEWNIGNFGHTYTTCDNVFAAVLQDGEGNDFLRIYEFERNKSIFWQADFHLPDDSRELICHVRMVNPFDKATTTYWWSNIAVPDDGKTRVLASNKNVISFIDEKCHFERLPNIEAMPGVDVTYPSRATRAFDYFIQKDKDGESTWEAAAYSDGLVFFERSTSPLYYKKLFTWGKHRAGKHWQEFLSDGDGAGYYAELQAGIAPSQLHDKLLGAGEKYEWTQCFGGTRLSTDVLFDENYDAAVSSLGKEIDSRISYESISELDEKYTSLADIPVREENILHRGSGFGALEIIRMEKDGDATAPKNLLFPTDTIGEAERPWLTLLESGKLPKSFPSDIPRSYMVSGKWLDRLLALENSGDFASELHLGVALYEYQRTDALISTVYDEEEDRERIDAARCAWLRSVENAPNVWALRNLAFLENKTGNKALAEEYYDKAISHPDAHLDYALASEYMIFLSRNGKFQKCWDTYSALPEEHKAVDRIKITAAEAAVKIGELQYLDGFFSEEHYDIREGEVSLTDIWFEYSARLLAKERGIENPEGDVLEELIDEAWQTCPPDYSIDFRMSTNREIKYRVY